MADLENKKPARRGPKPRGPYIDKRKTITTRITEETRYRLEEAAKASDRSLSQEIEWRLMQSFQTEDQRHAEFGGVQNYRLGRLIAVTISEIEIISETEWYRSEENLDYATGLVCALLENFAKRFGGWDEDKANPLKWDKHRTKLAETSGDGQLPRTLNDIGEALIARLDFDKAA